jgi:hypothetical protein
MNETFIFKQRRQEVKHLWYFINIAVDDLFDNLLANNSSVKWVKMYILFTDVTDEIYKRHIYIKDNPKKISKKGYLLKIKKKIEAFNRLNKIKIPLKEFHFTMYYET